MHQRYVVDVASENRAKSQRREQKISRISVPSLRYRSKCKSHRFFVSERELVKNLRYHENTYGNEMFRSIAHVFVRIADDRIACRMHERNKKPFPFAHEKKKNECEILVSHVSGQIHKASESINFASINHSDSPNRFGSDVRISKIENFCHSMIHENRYSPFVKRVQSTRPFQMQ